MPIYFDESFPHVDLESTNIADAIAEVEGYLRENCAPDDTCGEYEFQAYRITATICERCPNAAGAYRQCSVDDCDLCLGYDYIEGSEVEVEVVWEPVKPIEPEGPDTHAVVQTAFHGGGVVSTHTSEKGALWEEWRRTHDTDCCCGCVVIVPVEELEELRDACETPCYNSPAL